MTLNIYREMNPIWKGLAKNHAGASDLQYELELHQQLLKFFQVGDYYYFVFNLKDSCFDFLSSGIKQVLGYEVEEMTVPLFLERVHPEDRPYFLNFEHEIASFFSKLSNEQIRNYKVRYDYRVQRKDGSYVRILNQLKVVLFTDAENIWKTLMLHTDITELKPEGKPVLSFIGLNGEPSFFDVKAKERFPVADHTLSDREREVLCRMIEGAESEAIAKALFISRETVNTHRRNMLKKTGCVNTAQLIGRAVREGWV